MCISPVLVFCLFVFLGANFQPSATPMSPQHLTPGLIKPVRLITMSSSSRPKQESLFNYLHFWIRTEAKKKDLKYLSISTGQAIKLAQLNVGIDILIISTYLFCRKNMELESRKLFSRTKYANYYFLYELVDHLTSVDLDSHTC